MDMMMVPKAGSQHLQFLQSRASIVTRMSAKLFELYDHCTRDSKAQNRYTDAKSIIVELCKRDGHLSYQFSIEAAKKSVLELVPLLSEEGKRSLPQFENTLVQTLFQIGYREEILTPLEICLSGGKVQQNLLVHEPMKPIALIKKSLSLDEIELARGLAVRNESKGSFYSYWVGCASVAVSLEPLGTDGRAIKIPQVLDHEDLNWALVNYPLGEAFRACLEDSKPNKKRYPISIN